MKIFFIIVFLFIIVSLGTGLYHLVNAKDAKQSGKVAKALTVRIGLSLVLFIMIFIAYATGMIKPTGIGAGMHKLEQKISKKP